MGVQARACARVHVLVCVCAHVCVCELGWYSEVMVLLLCAEVSLHNTVGIGGAGAGCVHVRYQRGVQGVNLNERAFAAPCLSERLIGTGSESLLLSEPSSGIFGSFPTQFQQY